MLRKDSPSFPAGDWEDSDVSRKIKENTNTKGRRKSTSAFRN